MKQFKFINDAFLPLIKKCPILNKLNLNQTLIKKIETRDEEEKKGEKLMRMRLLRCVQKCGWIITQCYMRNRDAAMRNVTEPKM